MKWWLIVCAALCAVTLTACDAGTETIGLTQADDGSVQELVVGQEFEISLEANPTTGYAWEIDGALPPQLEQSAAPEFSASSDALGAGGTEVWTFTATEAGMGNLRLKYSRSFEPEEPPVATFSVTVDVR